MTALAAVRRAIGGAVDARLPLTGVALAALLLPGLPGQALGGLPLGPSGLLALALVSVAALGLPAPPRRVAWLLAGLGLLACAARLALPLAPPAGLTARYWAAAEPTGRVERSTDFRWLAREGATRVDSSLDLRGNQFAVHFLNDAARFNSVGDIRPTRDHMPFAVRWDGWLLAPEPAGERRLRLEAVGGARVWLDDREVLALAPTPTGARAAVEASLPLAPGLHALRVEYARPEARVPLLRLAWQPAPGAPFEPLAAPTLYRAAAAEAEARAWPGRAAALAAIGGLADGLLAALLVGWLAAAAWALRRRPAAAWARAGLAVLPLLFLVHGMALHGDLLGRATVLSGGDDWFTHESSARDILLNGPLMTDGRDSAPPYYAQVLYPYALALAHLLAGESLFGPLALQLALLGLTLVGAAALGWRLFGPAGGVAALAFFWAFLQQEHLRIARQLLNENLYMPLLGASLLMLVWLAQRGRAPSVGLALLCGVLLGITTLTRSQLLLFVPLALPILLLAWRREGGRLLSRRAVLAVAALLLGLGLTIAPATIRNYVVSGQVVLMSSAGGITLIYGVHEPPKSLDLSGIGIDPLYEALRLDRDTRILLEYIRRDPLGYWGSWLVNGAYSLGFTGIRRPDTGVYWGIVATVALYVASFSLASARRLEAWLVHAFVASHLVVMMAFEADAYGLRQPAPMYAPMAVFAAQVPLALLARLARWAAGRGSPGRPPGALGLAGAGRGVGGPLLPLAAAGLVACAALVQQVRGLADVLPRRDLAFHGLAGAAAAAVGRADRDESDVVYWAAWDGSPRRSSAGNLPGLRYPRIKWFDPGHSVPLPPENVRATYLLAEVFGAERDTRGVAACLGLPDERGLLTLESGAAAERCLAGASGWQRLHASFGGVARVDALRSPASAEIGESLEALLAWAPLRTVGEPYTTFIHLLDDEPGPPDVQWGNGTAQLYPPSQWEPGERIVSRLPVATDPTAIPGEYRVTLGFAPASGSAPPLEARWDGGSGDRVLAGTLSLVQPQALASRPLPPLPPTMRLLHPPPAGGGLELVATREPTPVARPGDQLRLGLVWRAAEERPSAARLRLKLVRQDGQVIQESTQPLLRGRFSPRLLRPGSVVRDEHALVLTSRVPSEIVSLHWELLDEWGEALALHAAPPAGLATIQVEARPRAFAPPPRLETEQAATFGGRAELLGYRVEGASVRPGGTVTVRPVWRALAEMDVPYKVFVQVLDPALQRVIAQRDAQPLDGAAPTTGWLPGEVIEDEYRVPVPPGTPAGEYPVQIGFYDPRTGERLELPDGSTRVILETRLRVEGR